MRERRSNKAVVVGSLRTFLTGGAVGTVSIGTPLMDVARALGPPRYFSTWADDGHFPRYWGYDHLEIGFDRRAPYKVDRFKLSPCDPKGRSLRLCSRLRLSLDGIHGGITPAEFLTLGVWPAHKVDVRVQLIAGELQLRIGHFPVEILYVVHDDDALDLSGEVAAFHDGNWRVLASFLEKKARLHSIAAFSKIGWRDRHWDTSALKTTAKSYLNTIGNEASAID